MDAAIGRLERMLIANPDDDFVFRRLVNTLARCGRLYDARSCLRQRFAAGRFNAEDLNRYISMGRQAGFISKHSVSPSPLTNFHTLFHSDHCQANDIEIVIGFASVHGAGAVVSVEALAAFFGVLPSRYKAPGEAICEFRYELPQQWAISPRFRVRAIRVTTIPSRPQKRYFRSRFLRDLNAMAFVADSRSDGTGDTNEEAFHAIDRGIRSIHKLGLDRFRFVMQYLEPPNPSLHRALVVAFGLAQAPRVYANIETTAALTLRPQPQFEEFRPGLDKVLAHEGIVDTFCLLLSRTVADLVAL